MSSSALPLPFSIASCSNSEGQGDRHDHSSLSLPPSSVKVEVQHRDSDPKTRTIRYRLSQLCRQGQPYIARQLFDSIPRPTTVVWNAIIIGFICNNMPHEAILFYARMKASTKSDSYTYSATLKACAQTRQLLLGKAVHCHILRSHFYPPSRIVSNSLLNMYVTCLSLAHDDMDSTESNSNSNSNSSKYESVRRVFDTMRKRNVVAWNTIISWYVLKERFVEAVEHFVLMMKTGIKPTVVSFINVLPAVSRMGDTKTANVLFALLIKLGSDYVNDLFVVSSAIFMYAELACLDFSRKIFDQCLERNTEVWNTMIGGYVQNNHLDEALDLFVKALPSQSSVVLDDVTFLSALTAASQLQQLNFAKQLHAYIIKNSSEPCVLVSNAIIVMYSRCNSIETSFNIFSRMHERDVVSWNTMISAFVQNGLNDEGLMLVYEMQKHGFVIDSITVTALLSAASNIRNKEIGKQTHAYLLRHGIQFEGMESYLIDMYAKSGLIKDAQEVFERNCSHDRDHATWNAMIAGNTQNGLIEQAFVVFRQMLEKTVPPNAVTLASVLPACNLVGSMAPGKQLHAFAVHNSLHQNVFVVSALVDMYSKLGAIAYAENIFATSPEKNSVTYTNMILGYGQHGMGEKALTLFHSMKECGIKPDPITIVAVLSACSYSGLVDEGLQIFESMEREYRIQPSPEHYCCVVDMLGRVGRVVEAYEFIKELGEESNVLGIWGSLLSACKIHGEFQLGKIAANKLLEMEGGNSTTGYRVLLSYIYAEEGSWEYVNRVRKGMQEKGLTKEVGCSWIDIAGYMNRFASRDRKHPLCDGIYEMLDILAVNMKDAGHRPCLKSEE